MHVVVVESPAKAKTLRGCLGAGHEVIATRGHVQDLAAKDGSVDPACDFVMVYAARRGAARVMRKIAVALADAEALVLATDPDREGEAIAWQVLGWLRERGALEGKAVRRVVFHEITPDAVRGAMAHPRALDLDLVRAQQARRALDYLAGSHLSALLRRNVRGGRPAGRVQSVALRLLCAREAEIETFEPEEYWTVEAAAMAERGAFTARLARLDGEALDRGRVRGGATAARAVERIGAGVFQVASFERGEVRRDPVPPFTTSTLQQEASRRLGFGVRKTMRLAQALYEGVELDGAATGLITYMRTDSVALSKSAAAAARRIVRERFGADWLPAQARVSRSHARNAREAHEAIRPTDLGRTPQGARRAHRRGRGEALHAHLDARRGEPDGRGPARPGHGSSSRRSPATSCSRPPARGPSSTASSGSGTRRATRTAARSRARPGASDPCPRWRRESGSS